MQRDMTPISNPLSPKIEAMLKGLSTPQLIDLYQREAANPSGDLKLTMVLGELKNRQKTAQQIKEVPNSTVAQDVVQKAAPQPAPRGIQQLQPQMPAQPQPQPQVQPQQPVMEAASGGVIDLPIRDDMFDDSYAGGGIVAFDGGGPVSYNEVQAAKQRYMLLKEQVPTFLPTPERLKGPLAQAEAEYRRLEAEWRRSALPAAQAETALVNQQFQQPAALTPQAPAAPQERPATDFSGIASMVTDLPSAIPGGVRDMVAPPAPSAPGAPKINYGLPNFMEGLKVPEATKLDEDTFLPKAKELKDITSTREEAYKAAGVSEKPLLDYAESLKGEKEGLAKDRENAFSDALIDFGTRMMAGRGELGEIIGKSLNPAAEKYSQRLDKLKEQEQSLNKQQFAAADALNRYRQTGADADLAEYRAADKDLTAAKRDFAKINAGFQDTHAGRQFTLDSQIAREKGDISRAELSAKLQAAGLDIQRFNAETQRFVANRPTEASFLIDNARQLFPNDPEKQTEYFVKNASAASAKAGTSTLQAKILDVKNKALDRLESNTEYRAARKAKDETKMRELELKEFNKVLGETPGAAAALMSSTGVNSGGWGALQVSGG